MLTKQHQPRQHFVLQRTDTSFGVGRQWQEALANHGHVGSAPFHSLEMETAFEKKGEQHRLVLFPICIHDGIMLRSMGWAADIRCLRHLGDFYRWKNNDLLESV
jgi:hypothetical protein